MDSKKVLALFILLVSVSASAGVTEKPCRPGQDRLIQLTKYRAAVRTDHLIRNVQQNLARSDLTFTQRRKLMVAEHILGCARGRLGTLRFVCSNADFAFAARTYPLISNNVYIADNYFQDIPIRQEATLLHEATHHCGTNDAQYFEPGRPPVDGDFIGWQSIADTYSFWVENGFCIPGYCR